MKGGSFLIDSDAPRDNYSIVNVQLSDGCCGCYESGWSRNLHYYNCKEFMGDKGYIKLTLQADRFSDKEEGDLIELYHSDTGEHENINIHCLSEKGDRGKLIRKSYMEAICSLFCVIDVI